MNNCGCDKCWPSEAQSAWELTTKLPIHNRLIDESHFMVMLRNCESCEQTFLQITTETIDWLDGEDPIFRTILPITDTEETNLINQTPISERYLETIGVDRKSLKYAWPKGEEQRVYWGRGIVVGRHD